MMVPNDSLTGVVTGVAFGGAGIMKHEGLVIFVPFTAVGDHVHIRITKVSKNFAHGELISIVQPSPDRTSPPCPYFGTCGGCQLQHLDYSAQLKAKSSAVKESLERIGGLGQFPMESTVPSDQPWAYRRHIRLSLRHDGKGFSAGYISIDHHTLLPVASCPIFVSDSEVFGRLQTIVSSFSSPIAQDGYATLLKEEHGQGYLCVFRFEKQFPANFEEIVQSAIKNWRLWKGITGIARGKTKAYGLQTASMTIDGLHFSYSPNAFVQSHPEQSKTIYRDICSLALQAKAVKAVDLYCGIGITSLLLAKQGIETLGVEENPEAVKLARMNAQTNQLSNVQFIQGDAAKELPKLPFFKHANLLIVNPPRIGLDDKVVEAIGKVHPKHLIYISCMPPTLARDLKKLSSFGYAISSCKPYDMFPQTSHVETLVSLC